jgi:hypothetical protein
MERDEMRNALVILLLTLGVATAAWAQGYEYQPSGLEYQPTVPVEAGQTVQALIRLPSGLTGLSQMQVDGVHYDDLFAYWQGTYNGDTYYYDIYSGYWKPGPVQYSHATLDFQGTAIEGWVRVFGPYPDYSHFFGRDGVLYKRINITRARTRDTNRRRQIIYTYFVNMATGERSDGEGLPYRYIGDAGVATEVVEAQMEARETQLADLVEDDPAYPNWEVEAFVPPEEITAPVTIPGTGEQSLLALIEDEVGPLQIELDGETADAPAEADGADVDAGS